MTKAGGFYYERSLELIRSLEPVIVDGDCISACTLILRVAPWQICATHRARFVFHAPWSYADDGTMVSTTKARDFLMTLYPSNVRRWIESKGGLTEKYIFLKGAEMYQYVQPCPSPVQLIKLQGLY